MRIAVATDHAGFPLKDAVIEAINNAGHEMIDLGVNDASISVDYPDYAERAGRAIQHGKADRAVVLCGSGAGVCITANKMKGVYASVCHDTYSAHQGVQHDNMNVLCLGGRIIGTDLAGELVRAFINAQHSNEERHQRRANKIRAVEEKG